MEARTEHQNIQRFKFLYAVTSTVGGFMVACVLFWCLYFRGGFAWTSDPSREFNWHPLLMVTSFIFLYSQSILVYRVGRNKVKKTLKLWHAIMHTLAFVLAVIGLQAAFDSHNLDNPPKPNLYTLHSWIGIITAILFGYQLLSGFLSFLYPTVSRNLRATFLPVHVSIGTATFVLAIIAAITGLLERGIILGWNKYSQRIPEAFLINFIGVIIAFFGLLVLYLVNEIGYKRQALPEDEFGLTGNPE